MGIQIEQITLRQIRMPLVHFFETSFGRTTERHMVLVEVRPAAFRVGARSPRARIRSTTRSGPNPAWLIVRDYVAPRVLNYKLENSGC